MRKLALFTAVLLAFAPPASAAPLQITKSSLLMSDPFNGAVSPKAIPGALVDYTIRVTNPNDVLTTVNPVTITDAIPANTKLYVNSLGTLSINAGLNLVTTSPVAFYDDNLLGLGVFGSGLTYTYSGLASLTDSLAFSSDNGVTWNYVPTPDADGCDSRVTHIRATFTNNFRSGQYFALRFRVKLK